MLDLKKDKGSGKNRLRGVSDRYKERKAWKNVCGTKILINL